MAKNSAEKALESIPSMRLLVAVCRKKSLTEAAKGLGMSLSAASHQLSVLKDAAGDPLFLRTDKGLAPTSAMKELLPKLESIIDAVDSLRKPAVFDPATAKRDIRILTYDMGYLAFVLPVVPRLQTESPGLRINVDFLESREFALNELRLGKADLCINPGLLNQSDVVSQPLGKVEYRLMVRQGHPLEAIYQAEGRVTLEEIALPAVHSVDAAGRLQPPVARRHGDGSPRDRLQLLQCSPLCREADRRRRVDSVAACRGVGRHRALHRDSARRGKPLGLYFPPLLGRA